MNYSLKEIKFSSVIAKNLSLFLSFLLILSLVYLPQISGSYVQHDDYYIWVWDRKTCWNYPLFEFLLILGRPISALSLCLTATQIEYVKDVNLFRFLSLVFVCLIATTIYNWLTLFNVNLILRWLICLAITTLPAFQFYVGGFGVTAPYMSFGIIMAVSAAMVLYEPVFPANKSKSVNNKLRIAIAIVMLIVSFMSYQAAAFYFMTLVSIPIIKKKISEITELKSFIIHYYGVFLTAFVIYSIIFRVFLYFMLKGDQSNQIPHIKGIVKDVVGKALWFLAEPFVNALNFWNVWPSITFNIIILAILASGISIEIIESYSEGCKDTKVRFIRNFLIKYLLIFSLIPFTCLLNLIVESNFPGYRTTGALASLLLILFIFSLQKFLYWIFRFYSYKEKLSHITLIVVISLGILTASYNLRYLFAENNSNELNYIEVEISKHISKHGKENLYQIHLIRPVNSSIFFKNRYDEMGVASTAFWQDINGIVRCAMTELRIGSKEYINGIKITSSSLNPNFKAAQDTRIPEDPKALIIDMNYPLEARLMKENNINQLSELQSMRDNSLKYLQ